MNVNVNQSRKNSLTRRFDRFGIKGLGVRKAAFINFGNLAALEQNGAGLDHLAVANEDARIWMEPGLSAPEFARQNARFHKVVLTPGLIGAESEERQENKQDPKFGRGPELFLLLPAKELGRDESANPQW